MEETHVLLQQMLLTLQQMIDVVEQVYTLKVQQQIDAAND
jgi:hypothetical protein